MKRLLLDTTVVVWLLLNDRAAVSRKAVRALSNERNAVSLSAVSVWEIAIKRSLGKLDVEASWANALTQLDFDPLPVTAMHARAVEQLPWHHSDPFDRLIVANAKANSFAWLISDDEAIAKNYPRTIW